MVFQEDMMYFSSKAEFLGECHQEIHTLDYEYDNYVKDYSIIGIQEAKNLDTSGISLDQSVNEHKENEEVTNTKVVNPISPLFEVSESDSLTDIQNQSSTENDPTLDVEPNRKRLPQCHTRGNPKPTYEAILSNKAKYPISKYVPTHHLSESNQSFLKQLSIVVIPNSVQEALTDPKWKVAMDEKMKSLWENKTWE